MLEKTIITLFVFKCTTSYQGIWCPYIAQYEQVNDTYKIEEWIRKNHYVMRILPDNEGIL